MPRSLPLGCAILCLLPGPSTAQPYTQSMMDCAALYQTSAGFVTSTDKANRLLALSDAWTQAAVQQSAADGAPQGEAAICSQVADKASAWKTRGAAFFLTQDFRDWMAYCRSFGQSLRLDLPGPG